MKEISGKQLYYAFAAGGEAVIAQRETLNKINVYPVPDGDTGSNLSFTFKSIIEQTQIFPDSAGATMQSLAESALSGARGNSGILFAQFVNGMAEKIGDVKALSMQKFSAAVSHAASTAYKAISNPVEGTILTVMHDFAGSLKEGHLSAKDFIALFKAAMKSAKKSLQSTKDKLETLKKANVIDAGAKGFVAFLEGFHRFIEQGAKVDHLGKDPRPEIKFNATSEHHDEVKIDEELTFRYCTEGYMAGKNMDLAVIRADLNHYGNSLIVAGNSKLIRIHIHTDHPDRIFTTLKNHGKIREQKADDMYRQYQMVHARKSEIALVVDSTCDLPDKFLDDHQIYQVPLLINFGDTQYLDRITLKAKKFYQLLKTEKEFPQTSQPSVKTFANLFDHLTSHYTSVISISISSNMSGTFSGANQAAENFEGAKISTVDSKECGAGLGLLAMQAALDIKKGLSHEEVVNNIYANRKRTHTFLFARNLKNLVRGGRVSPIKGLIGRILSVKPIITVTDDGKAANLDKAYSIERGIDKIIDRVSALHREKGIRNLAIVQGSAAEKATEIAERIESATGIKADYVGDMTPVLGAHGGIGAINLAVITERE